MRTENSQPVIENKAEWLMMGSKRKLYSKKENSKTENR